MKTPEEIKRGLECCAYERVSNCPDCPYLEPECEGEVLEGDALSYIQQLECQFGELAKLVPKWISVEEKLPKEAEDVLVFCRNDTITWVVIAHHVGRQWWRVGVPIECVTHWMPLPEPPKEE